MEEGIRSCGVVCGSCKSFHTASRKRIIVKTTIGLCLNPLGVNNITINESFPARTIACKEYSYLFSYIEDDNKLK